ncbi:MAG: DNA translocase FtsK 4TM domain-containing protein [Salinivirgaceae bacterium]|nr:DNA translocase FtsK 4TM domain-containing protein [Salinivirgaceae bacterium]
MAKKKNFNTSDDADFNMSDRDRRRTIAGVCLAAFTIYLTFAFISYLFTWRIDQSSLDVSVGKLFSNPNIVASNWAGTIGALLAQRFLYKWIGLTAFGIIIILTVIILRLFKIKTWPIGRTIKLTTVYAIWGSIALGYLFHYSAFTPGGAHGYFVSEWLNAVIGKLGTGILLITCLFAILSFTFDSFIARCRTFVTELIHPKVTDIELPAVETDNQNDTGADLSADDTVSGLTNDDTDAGNQDDSNDGDNDDIPFEKNDKDLLKFEIKTTTTIDESDNQQNNNPTDDSFDNLDDVESKLLDDYDSNDNDNSGLSSGQSDFSITYTTKENIEIPSDENTENEQDGEVEMEVTKGEEETQTARDIDLEPYDPTRDLENYRLPSIELLNDYEQNNTDVPTEELNANKDKIVETLNDYKIQIAKINATVGPTVTLYEIVPAKGVKISKIKNLSDDIALSLAALGIRIIAPIPGRGTIGIEVPNTKPQTVAMRTVLASKKFQESNYELPVAIGKTITNETFTFDLTKTPHLLVAGATGQGKSVGLNAILTSLLYKKHPAQLKLVLVDPKKVELTLYKSLEKYFLAKLPDAEEAIITDTQKVVNTLQSLCIEMDTRYDLLKNAACRNIKEYNAKFISRRLNPNNGHRFLPYIVVVIDEFADLIMTAGKEVELPIARLAQLARAIGIHLIIATQRPTTNIITGLIKANFPARIAFKVMSMIDSRTILDAPGANQLIGRGDMLISMGSETTRVQCAFVDTPELERIMEHIEQQQSYPGAFELPEYIPEGSASGDLDSVDLSKRDSMFEEAARIIVINQQGSTSLIQRKFSIGYNRAGRIMDQLEAAGIVGPFQGAKAREVLIPDELSLDRLLETLR